MTDLEILILYLFGVIQGISIGFIFFAPDTPFKRGFIDGLTMRFLWDRKKK